MNIENLEKMIPIWYSLDDDETIGVECDMTRFRSTVIALSDDPKHLCGTAACGLGVSILFIPPDESEHRTIKYGFDYSSYGHRVFGIDPESREWAWLFSGLWGDVDDTYKGVALRAKYLLDHGTPDTAFNQSVATVSYMFQDEESRKLVL